MRFKRFDLNLLVVLDALLQERSVSRAAERVYISQPAMSNALARLRTHYGDPLMTSVGRRMVLTERGASLQRLVSELMPQVQRTVQANDRFDAAKDQRCFSITASDYFASVVLPALLQHCAVHAPRVSFDVAPLSPKLSEELDRGEIDLLIVPEAYAFATHAAQTLFEDTWVCVAWSGSRRWGASLTEAQYLRAEHVVKRENNLMFKPLDNQLLSRMDVARRIAVKVPMYSLVANAVIGTDRIATVQARLAQVAAQSLPLRILPMPFPLPPLVERMQWHVLHENDEGNRWLRETLAAICRAIDAPAPGRRRRATG